MDDSNGLLTSKLQDITHVPASEQTQATVFCRIPSVQAGADGDVRTRSRSPTILRSDREHGLNVPPAEIMAWALSLSRGSLKMHVVVWTPSH